MPVCVYSVAREMGPGSEAMVGEVYGHLGMVRHRSDVVEYRIDQHAAKLGVRLVALRGGFWHQRWHHGVDLSTTPP